MATTQTRNIYAAIAQHSGRDAGHICYGRTKEAARATASARTTMTFVVRRERATDAEIAALVAVGKLSASEGVR